MNDLPEGESIGAGPRRVKHGGLAVADDGIGFDLERVRSDGFGLTSMQDRAARAGVALTFVTEPGSGTEVVASWSP